MGELSWTFALVLVTTSFGTALLALLAATHLLPERRVRWDRLRGEPGTMTFLFENADLVDATEEARAFLATGPETLEPWPRLLALLSRSFPDVARQSATLGETGGFNLRSFDGTARLEAEWRAGLARFTLVESGSGGTAKLDSFSIAAMTEELGILRAVVDDVPVLAWREDAEGNVTWTNGAYIDLLRRMYPDQPAFPWPMPRIFPRDLTEDGNGEARRVSVTIPYIEQEIWYDCSIRWLGGEIMVFATPADRLVRAERSRLEFLQTLTKTFADLPIGLAVFDRGRQLALFNPALTDLSALEPMFLSSRPTLVAFLDRLREAQRMPEPKDYKSWRQSIAELESAAAEGMHQEIWSLPTGQTYRITGQPHPDGAIALLFEDISAEMSLTRRFRSELEMGQAVVDSLPEAIAVFSHAGSMVLCNRAYQEMWDCDLSASLSDITAFDAVRDWQRRCGDPALWSRVLSYISQHGKRAPWSTECSGPDGRMACRFAPVPGGATLVGFSRAEALSTPPRDTEEHRLSA